VYYDPEESERLAPALDRGKALLTRLHAQASKIRLDETEYCYELVLAGKPIGYLTRRIWRDEYVFSGPNAKRRNAKDGVRVRERWWRFEDDGTVRRTRFDCFSSFDHETELVENQQWELPAAGTPNAEALSRMERVVREVDVLLSSTSTSRDKTLPEPSKPISIGPVYLDQTWLRLLPGLLLGSPPELYALATYNFDTRALISLTIQPRGEQPLAGFDKPASVFEVREGFIARPSVLYCDAQGNMLRSEAGEFVVTRVPREDVERKYGPRRDAALQRYQLQDD
jgi:hypothetical protein